MTEESSKWRLAEARRRAAILDRYVKIALPTAEDDAAFAAELNLNVGRLLRLADVWKKHRSELLLLGPGTALANGSAAAMEDVLAEEIDLSRVLPDRRAETLRRIRIMQRHLASGRRGREDVAAAAEEMGGSPAYFLVLLRTWLVHARAEALAGATKRGTPWRRQPDRARRTALLESIVTGADPSLSVKELHNEYARACAARNLKPLSLPRFYAVVQALRERRPRSAVRSNSRA